MEKDHNDFIFMQEAMKLAKEAGERGEVPVGAVIVKDGNILCGACNNREEKGYATGHAEILAIERACEILGGWRLSGCTLYVTLEPCPMCAGAIINSRLDRVVYGAKDPNAGCFGSIINFNSYPFNHSVNLIGGICADECLKLLKDFFNTKRKNTKNNG